MRSSFILALAAALASLAGTAAARAIPEGGLTQPDVVAPDGSAQIYTEFFGYRVAIVLFDCKGARCGSMQLAAAFSTQGKFDTAQMNEWNREKRWCRGYFDAVKDPWVEFDIDLTPGASYELLDDQLGVFKVCLADFVQKYGL
jgi:hypothetical protein